MNEKPPQNNSESYSHLRENITVGRNAYRKDGTRAVGINGEPIYKGYESGWSEIEVYTNEKGIKMSIVAKSDIDPETGGERFAYKHVLTAEIDDIQERLRNTQREKTSDTAGKAALELVEVAKPEVSEHAERLYQQRLKELAQPLKTNSAGEYLEPDADSGEAGEYDLLFDESIDIENRPIEDAAVHANKLEKVEADNIEAARKFISGLPQDLEAVFKRVNEGNRPLSRVDIARNNHQARVELLDALLKIVDSYQIRPNDKKTINYGRTEKNTSSQEAAALFALSMLDGSFDGAASRIDPVVIDADGQVRLGKHRYAALKALGADDRTFAKAFVGFDVARQ